MTTETRTPEATDATRRRPRDVRFGMIVPFDMALDREYWQFLPDHASVHVTRLPIIDLPYGLEHARLVADPPVMNEAVRTLVLHRSTADDDRRRKGPNAQAGGARKHELVRDWSRPTVVGDGRCRQRTQERRAETRDAADHAQERLSCIQDLPRLVEMIEPGRLQRERPVKLDDVQLGGVHQPRQLSEVGVIAIEADAPAPVSRRGSIRVRDVQVRRHR